MTLDTATFLAAALRAAAFGAAFFALAAVLEIAVLEIAVLAFDFAAVFFAERGLAVLRADDLEEVALLAFGLEADFVLTARFAVFAVGFAFERDADRLKPFVRLLLI